MLFGTSVAGALLCTATTRRAWRSVTFGSRPAVFVGSFSYSLYLIHAPVLETLQRFVVEPLALPPFATFVALVTVVLPVVLAFCYGFYRLFEKPFLDRRDMAALRTLPVWGWLSDRHRSQRARRIQEEPA
jgi:peptidoglycan/LPS O-acetylase OafA/YrhL